MTREEAKHIVDVAFCVPQAVRRAGEDRTYHEDEIREAKNMAIKALEQEPKTGRWVPVSERLPEKNVWVLTCYRMGNGRIDIDIKRINRWNNQWEDDFDFCNTVIAWMPLPKPYEPQESEKE